MAYILELGNQARIVFSYEHQSILNAGWVSSISEVLANEISEINLGTFFCKI
jgi:hypothetical protein